MMSVKQFDASFVLTVVRMSSVANDTGLLIRNLLFELKNTVSTGELKVQVGSKSVAANRTSLTVLETNTTCDPGYAVAQLGDSCGEYNTQRVTYKKGKYYIGTSERRSQ